MTYDDEQLELIRLYLEVKQKERKQRRQQINQKPEKEKLTPETLRAKAKIYNRNRAMKLKREKRELLMLKEQNEILNEMIRLEKQEITDSNIKAKNEQNSTDRFIFNRTSEPTTAPLTHLQSIRQRVNITARYTRQPLCSSRCE